MKCANYLLLSLLVMFCASCEKSTDPTDGDLPPPGYQEDILWPSLAKSSWPRDHGDAQSTGRSKFPGPASGSVLWSIDTVSLNSGISLGEDGSIYISPHSEASKSGLYKVSVEGEIDWYYDTGNTISNMTTPMVTSDGTVIASNGYGGSVFAINPDGTLKWECELGESMQQRGINIGKDGTIYAIDGIRILHAISPEGIISWSLSLEMENGYQTQGASFSPDGKTLYTRGQFNALIAVDVTTQSIKWTFGDMSDSGPATQPSSGEYSLLATVNSSTWDYVDEDVKLDDLGDYEPGIM
jgi:hypothetical protein